MDGTLELRVAVGSLETITMRDMSRPRVREAWVAEALQIQLLGGFQVSVGARSIDDDCWYLRKAKSLLKLLALAPRHRMHREQIMELLWPELDAAAASNNLHKALHVARHALEPALPPKCGSSYLLLQQDFVVLALPGASCVDVAAFETSAREAQLAQDPELYEAALRLYRGDLLPEDRSEDWVVGQREMLKGLQVSLLLELAGLYERREHLDRAIEALRQVVAVDPVNEEAHLHLMQLLARTGQRTLALRQYRQLCEALRRDLDAPPEPRIQTIYQRILTGELGSATQTPPVPAAHTPSQRSQRTEGPPLIGREHEALALKERVDRLAAGAGGVVLLRGEAGIGKSRLAAEAREYAARHELLILWGGAHAHDGPFAHSPFAVALEAFAERAALAGVLPERVAVARRLAGPVRAGDAVPAAAVPDPEERPPAQAEWHDLALTTAEFFRQLAATTPVLVVLDDLHLADRTNLELLQYLARSLRDAPILFVATYRTDVDRANEPLRHVVSRLQREQLADCLSLQRLSFSATVDMIGALLVGAIESAVFERVYALASGNPHYTAEAVQALRGRGQLQATDGRWHLQIETRVLPSSAFLRHPGKR